MAETKQADHRWTLADEPARQPRLSIFINYRRYDADIAAGWLKASLTEDPVLQVHFDVFRDDDIDPLQKYEDVIMENLLSSDVLLVVIGRDWLTITDKSGRRRLEQEEDLLRREIEAALKSDVKVVPILLGDVSMPSRDDLPQSLAVLADWQAHRMESTNWKSDLGALVERLDEYHARKTAVGQKKEGEGDTEEELARRQREAEARARQARRQRRIARLRTLLTGRGTIGAAALIVVAAAGFIFWPRADGDWSNISDAITPIGADGDMTAAASVPNASLPYLVGGQIGGDAALWLSQNGESWGEPITDEFASPSGAETWINAIVAPRQMNLMAIGVEEAVPGAGDVAVWHSEDGQAMEWDRAPGELGGSGSQEAVTARRVTKPTERFLLLGGREELAGEGKAALWRALGAVGPWERLEDETLQRGDDGGITRILCFPVDEGCSLIVALGWSSQGGDEDATVWTSETGTSDSWTRHLVRAAGDQRITDAVPFGDGLVAVGFDGDDAAVWRSLDGISWTPVSGPEPGGIQRAEVVVTPTVGDGQATGLIAAGSHADEGAAHTDAAVWTSSDGLTWTQAGPADAFGGTGDQRIVGLVARIEPMIAVGSNGTAPGAWCRGC